MDRHPVGGVSSTQCRAQTLPLVPQFAVTFSLNAPAIESEQCSAGSPSDAKDCEHWEQPPRIDQPKPRERKRQADGNKGPDRRAGQYPARPLRRLLSGPTASSRTANRIQPAEPFVNVVPTDAVSGPLPLTSKASAIYATERSEMHGAQAVAAGAMCISVHFCRVQLITCRPLLALPWDR